MANNNYTKGEWRNDNGFITANFPEKGKDYLTIGLFHSEPNAERTVLCVNNHDALVEALARLIDRIEESNLTDYFPSALRRAKEALAQIK